MPQGDRIETDKYVVTNKLGQYIGIDNASGYPFKSEWLIQAKLFDKLAADRYVGFNGTTKATVYRVVLERVK